MTTINTTTTTTGLAFCNGRHIARTSTGRIWVAFNNASIGSLEFWYSDNDGSSFTRNASADIATVKSNSGFSFFIDIDDHAHVVCRVTNLEYRRMTNIGTATSWGSAYGVSGTYTQQPDIVAFRDGASWIAAIAASNGNGIYVYILTAVDSTPVVSQTLGTYGGINYPSIDFNHTGDGKTIAGSAPHIYFAGVSGADLALVKLTYSGGTYSGGKRFLDSTGTKNDQVSLAYDGTRSVIAYAEGAVVYIAERDAADTTTTLRTPTALSDGTITNVSVSYDSAGDIHLWAVGATSDDLKRIVFDRSLGTWGSWVTEYSDIVFGNSLTLKRGYSNSTIDAVFLGTSGGSPYNVTYASLVLNVAPTAPTWQAPADNSAQDIDASLPLAWNFNDPDPGDTQSAYVLERQVNGGAAEFYNAGGPSWGAGLTVNESATESVTLAASWATDGDSIAYRVKTRDAAAVEGPFSVVRTVVASVKVEPSLTVPADGGTVTSASVEVTWTATEQTAYQLRILTDADVLVSTTGKVTSTSKTVTPDTVLANGETYKAEVTTWNDDDLESTPDTHSFDVVYTPPATPVLTVTTSGSAISVAIADPTPTGSQPTVDTHDIFVRVAAGGRQSNERTVGDDGIRISTGTVPTNGTYLDEKAAGSTDFEYRSLAKAENGAATYSAWS
jgi:hypothetical protein